VDPTIAQDSTMWGKFASDRSWDFLLTTLVPDDQDLTVNPVTVIGGRYQISYML
jgi:hypothetical protein